ncbi:MAG: ABC transporter ATP-binding protein [Ancalomicrobiaceae bacterium]|nr:ABC transporter ATP-binding protein [Ancalomicrobiaceae bacterium]
MALLSWFERLIQPTATGAPGEPPKGLVRFYWFFTAQVVWFMAALVVAGFALALCDAAIPVFIGELVQLIGRHAPADLIGSEWSTLLWMAVVILVLRPLAILVQNLLNQVLLPGFTNLIRWQSHWHVARQTLAFFQNDFAGRIASRVVETGNALRGSLVALVWVVWYMIALAGLAVAIYARADVRLLVPAGLWAVGYVALLAHVIPRIRATAREISFARSGLVGRIVDSYTNIATVKLFARAEKEDAFVREAVDDHTGKFRAQMRQFTLLGVGLNLLSGFLLVGTGAVAVVLWTRGVVGIDAIATVLPLGLQLTGASARVAYEVTGISDQVGTVTEGMETIAHPIGLKDAATAVPLAVAEGAVRFDDISFHYGRTSGVIEHLSLDIRPGEKIGLVGRSGAGKSTLVNLLLRFYDLESGTIRIDGTNIASVTQESLRENISMVTQDTSLLHRSILDNIRYGRPEATFEEVKTAAELAHAHDFILELEDWKGRRGYDAHVGERGVKLSGGQRQRIAIARVILKNAPILILDEATSALDSEVEAAIQSSLESLMAGKTVIAIAHRLSTIARMDRLVILEHGRIIESGSHADLLALDGHYAQLWRRQSGGFLTDDEAEEAGKKAAE